MKNWIRNLSLKTKLLGIILLSIGIISLSAALGIGVISNAYNRTLYRSLHTALSYASSELSKSLDETDSLAGMLLANQTIQTQLSERLDSMRPSHRSLAVETIYSTMNSYLLSANHRYISFITICQGSTTINSSYTAPQYLPAEVRERLIQIADEQQGSSFLVTEYCQDYGLFLVKQLRESKNLSFRPLGTLIARIDLDYLLRHIYSSDQSMEGISYFLLQGDDVLYSSGGLEESSISYLRDHLERGYGILSSRNQDLFVVRDTVPGRDLDIVSAVPYGSVTSAITQSLFLSLFIILGSILSVILAANLLVSSLNHSFDRLIEKMHRFGKGNYSLSEQDLCSADRRDEIGELNRNINAMAVQIHTLIQENYVNELLKKEGQLKALESQRDPHFLYNTLDSINRRAKAVKAADISQITTALGSLLRISLSKSTDSFTIRQELELIACYMTIQRLRYPRKLDYEEKIPEEFFSCPIPKFTVQPLLENAIRYGLEQSSDICRISLAARREGNDLLLYVKNTGSLFEENLMDKLDSGQVLPHGFGIGILNVHRRLTITYGPQYGLSLSNEERDGEEYAVVCVRIPLPAKQNREEAAAC